MNEIPSKTDEPINTALRSHQVSLPVEEWVGARHIPDLYSWAGKMLGEFKLDIPTPALAITQLRSTTLGHYRRVRNGFGIRDEIAISTTHIANHPYWQILGTLCHELLHSWQKHHSQTSKYRAHNKKYRIKAAELGLIVDTRGVTAYADGDTPFFRLLRTHGIEVPEAEILTTQTAIQECRLRINTSKLKLYECPCGVKVRVGRSRFHAKCLDCDGVFEMKG